MLASALIHNSVSHGSLFVEEGSISFLPAGDLSKPVDVTEIRDRGSVWALCFGEYGWFEVKKSVILSLDQEVSLLFASARKVRTSERKQKLAESETPGKVELREVITERRVEKEPRTAWEIFLRERLKAASMEKQLQADRMARRQTQESRSYWKDRFERMNWNAFQRLAADTYSLQVVGVSRAALIGKILNIVAPLH